MFASLGFRVWFRVWGLGPCVCKFRLGFRVYDPGSPSSGSVWCAQQEGKRPSNTPVAPAKQSGGSHIERLQISEVPGFVRFWLIVMSWFGTFQSLGASGPCRSIEKLAFSARLTTPCKARDTQTFRILAVSTCADKLWQEAHRRRSAKKCRASSPSRGVPQAGGPLSPRFARIRQNIAKLLEPF